MKAFIIHLPSRAHSVEYATKMCDELIDMGIDAELFEGVDGRLALKDAQKKNRKVYPFSIKNRRIYDDEIEKYIKPSLWKAFKENHYYKIVEKQRIGDDIEKFSLPGVVGCFYSHYKLWRVCMHLDEPIMIFEDDVKFFNTWHPIDWDDVLVLSLGKSSFLNEPYKSFLESPTGSPQPISWPNFSMPGASGYAIKPNAAKALVKFYQNYYYPADNAINQQLVKIQVHNYMMGRNTLPEEGNISLTRAKDWSEE